MHKIAFCTYLRERNRYRYEGFSKPLSSSINFNGNQMLVIVDLRFLPRKREADLKLGTYIPLPHPLLDGYLSVQVYFKHLILEITSFQIGSENRNSYGSYGISCKLQKFFSCMCMCNVPLMMGFKPKPVTGFYL